MPVASGYSIQRNEIINLPHRQQYETHSAEGTKNQFYLRSKIDFENKDWEWNIKVGGVRYDLDRKKSPADSDISGAGNSYTSTKTDKTIWDSTSDVYCEGDITAGNGAVRFRQDIGVFGGLEFAPEYTPSSNEILEITYQEHEAQWTGSSGGLLYQLAKDMCVHPYQSPEIFKLSETSPVYQTPGDSATDLLGYVEGLSEAYSYDYVSNGVQKSARTPSSLFKLVREHRETYEVDLTTFDSSVGVELTGSGFPLSISDLGDGELRVSINGRVIPASDWVVSDAGNRSVSGGGSVTPSKLTLMTDPTEYLWMSSDDLSTAKVVVGFHWKHSLAVPYGAVVGKDGSNDEGFTINTDFSYSVPTTERNAQVEIKYSAGDNNYTANDSVSESSLSYVKNGDLFLLNYMDDDQFEPAFKLVYPKPVSNDRVDVEAALKQISTKFLVESSKGVDLLSDENLTPISTDPTSNKTRPQNWRVRFEYSGDGSYLKVNVATAYQLLDDMTITQGQGRDGIKYPIYREPGELCDVYQEPSIGRGVITRVQKAKSQFFTRVAKSEDETSRTYPLSYRMTVTDHGFGLFLFDQASVDQDDDYAWFVVQRHVDQTTGQPEFSNKSPVHCVYSPTKRPLEISDLNTYYSTQDVADLSKPRNIFDSFGRELETESPTIFVNKDQGLFNDFVNAIDFTGPYANPLADENTREVNPKTELDVGFIGGSDVSEADAKSYWYRIDENSDETFAVSELSILGFNALGRSGDTTIMGAKSGASAGAAWLTNPAQQTGVQLSGNVTFPVSPIEPISNFNDALSVNDGPKTLSDWEDPSYALLDILYNEVSANREKVFESMVVALDGVEILRDPNAYLLTYDEWVRRGDPSTVQRFLEGLDNAGVQGFGEKFRLPTDAGASGGSAKVFVDGLSANSINETKSIVNASGQPFDGDFVTNLQALDVSSYIVSSDEVSLRGKLPGDPIFSDYGTSQLNLTAGPNRYLYDFFNQTLYFRDTPRSGSSFSMKLVNYNSSTPSQTTYIISVPPDRDLPNRNQNAVKTINRFVVRENDVLKPWDYHVSATMHETDSNSIINPQEQLSITQDRDFVFSFPTQLTTQRFYYPRSELDLIAISSADFSTQAGHIEIDKYSDSNGVKTVAYQVEGVSFDPTPTVSDDDYEYAGHVGPDKTPYIWKRSKRKYEGMMSTQPNGNGMRVFLQVTGSSIRYSDVTEGSVPQ